VTGHGIALAARVALAVVFVVAAAAKLADLRGTRTSVAALGIPAPAARLVGTALPVVELSVASALLIPDTARIGAVAAAVLLSVFSGAIAVNLARGRRPACNCFGQLRSQPIGVPTLIRNLALLGLALLATVT
jgi:uncharacterized membrane protein YphA (DoxX/SURF4 family)